MDAVWFEYVESEQDGREQDGRSCSFVKEDRYIQCHPSLVEEEEVTYTVIDQFQQKFGAAVSTIRHFQCGLYR
jgi:hypothetical protein